MMTTIREAENPLRPCKKCGSVGNSYKLYRGDKVVYSALCRACNKERTKSKIHTNCGKCGAEKEPTYIRYCKTCLSKNYYENNLIMKYEDLVTIKRWVRKQEIRNWMTDLEGINELIDIYELIKRGDEDFETYTPGKQLQRMWNNVYKMWLLIKDLDDKSLKIVRIDKRYLKIENNMDIERLNTTQEELNFFFKNLNEFVIDGRIYSLENEYRDCLSKKTKVSCTRCRKIISQLRKDLIVLNKMTGVKWTYKNQNGKK